MSSKKGGKGGDAPATYDPQALLSLYGMQYAGLGGLTNLGAAYSGLTSQATTSAGQSQNGAAAAAVSSSDAATSATNAWYAMASQLAAQDYLTRLQAAARDPAAYAALASQGVLPNYEMLTQGAKGGRSKAASSKGRNSPAASSTSSRASPAVSSPSLDALRLPSDTEIIKYTSSSTGPKIPGTTNRGRKKTISLDPSPSPYASAASAANFGALGALLGAAASQGDLGNGGVDGGIGGAPSIPPGLTIERKKPGRKPMDPDNHVASASASAPMVDRVEITKVPINSSASSISGGANGRSDSPSVSITTRDFPASSSHALSSLMLSTSSATNAATITPANSKIPSDYYATQALSGVFLAEQIRQQQLAAALESRLSESGKTSGTSTTDLVQAALLMNRLKEQQQQQSSSNTLGAAETSKLLAIAAAAAAASNPDQKATAWKSPTSTKANRKVPPKKNTVASLLEQAKSGGLGTSTLANPELTIEPLFKSFQPDSSFENGSAGSLKIKNISDSPEIRNLSDQEAKEVLLRGGQPSDLDGTDHGSTNSVSPPATAIMLPQQPVPMAAVMAALAASNSSNSNTNATSANSVSKEDGKSAPSSKSASTNHSSTRASLGRYATVETAELRIPLECGWKRETLVREYSKSGVRGDVVYYAPCGKKFKQYPDIVRHLEKNGMANLTRDHFSFSTKIFIGEFLKPTGQRGDDGEEKYLKLNEQEMLDDVDKIRRENGWKPLKRSLPPPVSPASGTSTPNNAVLHPPASKKAHISPSPTPPPSLSALTASSTSLLSSLLPSMTPEQKILARLQAEIQLREQQAQREEELRLQKEALRYIREAERLERLEQARREKEARQREQQEAKRRRQEEARIRQEENLKRLQEKEAKRQQAALAKEQKTSSTIDMGSLYQAAMERERRRQHMLLMKALEGKKRCDEREKRREDLRVEKERERERRIEQKRLENEIVAEMRKPVEDMCLPQAGDGDEGARHALPELPRVPELMLSGEAFANVLMVYEFLHNFGERLGFDMESLPTLNDLQAALLNDPEAEEELLSVVIHLLVCAIDDPGIPTPHKHLTLLGQNLRQADITNTNVSEILKIYLTARGQVEVKNLHGVTPPETHSLKDRSREIPFCHKRMEEFNRLLKKTRAWEMAQWVKERPFLCLNPTEKGEILAFVCNELLFNKSVMHQIESNVEGVNKAKKVRLVAEARLRKLKHIQARKVRMSHIMTPSKPDMSADNSQSIQSHAEDTTDKGSELASNSGDVDKEDEEDDKESVRSESVASESNQTPTKKKRGRPRKYGKTKYTKKKKRKPEPEPEPEEEPEEEPEPEESEDDLDDLENEEDMNEEELEKLTAEEITKKVERATRLTVKSRDDLVHISNCLRVNDLGQDRYRRRYWHFAHAGGVFVEGMESAEPWKLPFEGMPHEKDKLYDRKRREEEEEEEEDEEPKAKVPKIEGDVTVKGEDKENAENEPKKEEENSKEDAVKSEEDKQRLETQEALKKLGHEILVTPKTENDKKSHPASTPKVTPNGDKLNLFNHSAHFHMTLSPVVLNGSVTITPKNEPAGGGLSTSSPVVGGPSAQQQAPCPPSDKPWFSLLPLSKSASNVNNANNNYGTNAKEHSTRFAEFRREKCVVSSPDKTQALLSSQCPVNPQIALLELKLKELRKTNFNKQRKPIPDEFSRGWWRIEEVPTMIELERKLNMRGAREQLLLQNSKRNLDFMHEIVHAYSSLDTSAVPSGAATPTNEKSASNGVINNVPATPKPKPLGEPLGLEPLDEVDDIKILDCGVPAPDVPGNWSWEVALRCDKYILEQVEALEDKVAAASMQVPGWKLPDRPDIEKRDFRPSCCPPDKGDDRPDPITEARERLLDLEAAIERRYLKAPLGHSNAEINLQTITSNNVKPTRNSAVSRRTTNTSLNISKELANNDDMTNGDDDSNANGELNESHDENGDDDNHDDDEAGDSKKKEKSNLPRGLVAWREGVRKAETAAQLAMGFYVLETSIAWHKSIMKAFCQLCHSGDDEDSLLLCDGCDKGYHMYCFKPSITTVPDGDWYCFECINKATGIRHCLVCGKQDGKHLVPCTSCPRAYHTECLSPALSKVPRGKWQCPGCNQKTKIPRKKIPKKLKIIVGPPDTDDITTNTSNASVTSETTKETKKAKREREEKEREEKEKEEAEKREEKEKEEELERQKAEEKAATPEPPPEKKPRKEYKKKSKEPKEATPSKTERDLTPCRILVGEMEACDDSWPFLFPVNAKQFPTYKKIIKRPMDIATIKRKLDGGQYATREEFCDDVRLIFANCEVFNEDDSPVGKAGHAMRHLFDTRWVELIGQEAKGEGTKSSSSSK